MDEGRARSRETRVPTTTATVEAGDSPAAPCLAVLAPILEHRGTPTRIPLNQPQEHTLEILALYAITPVPTAGEYLAVFGPSWRHAITVIERVATADHTQLNALSQNMARPHWNECVYDEWGKGVAIDNPYGGDQEGLGSDIQWGRYVHDSLRGGREIREARDAIAGARRSIKGQGDAGENGERVVLDYLTSYHADRLGGIHPTADLATAAATGHLIGRAGYTKEHHRRLMAPFTDVFGPL